MAMKYWGMYASQPCRTVVYIFRRLAIPYEHNEVRPRFDTRSVEFKRTVNRWGKTPVIEHHGVKMVESAAISRYLLALFDDKAEIMPRDDLLARQRVDAMLDVNGNTYRPVFMPSYWEVKLSPICFGVPVPSQERVDKIMSDVHFNLKDINEVTSLSPFVAGEKFSIADVQIYNEVFNVATHFEIDLSEYVHLKTW
eukprot:CAMPEP_0168331550 /NCGR_PEP_ID=MMETSP0213-20121227/8400_1 /TAXON_ID=151035 /ORGANISM="Euplotes harpa, Strain FSP1.4" /LENGTH=195 /DNA_ID=CAMNT_0008335347 /DNA_START=21 /DNA_END=605 /DNA_ORIENTATION=+